MNTKPVSFTKTFVTLCILALASNHAVAQPIAQSIPFSPFGDAIDKAVSAPAVLTSSSILVPAEGPDGVGNTADDVLLLVEGLGAGTPTKTALATPYLSDGSGQNVVVVSSTRALIASSGPDQSWETADDLVYLLNDVGNSNTVTPIPVGPIKENSGYKPVVMSNSMFVISTVGADLSDETADDTLARITGLGTTNTVTQLAAPYLRDSGSAQPAPLSATSLLLTSSGPDGSEATPDDVVYLFTDVGNTATRTDIAVPNIADKRPGIPATLSATRALVSSAGPDGSDSTADDLVYLLDNLGSTNNVTPIAAPNIQNFGAGQPVSLTATLAVLSTEGADSSEGTADDSVLVLSGLGTTNTVTEVIVGPIDEDGQSQCIKLSSNSCALTGEGADSNNESADDVVIYLSDIGNSNTRNDINIPGLEARIISVVSPISATAFMVASGGPDFNVGSGSDDVITIVSQIDQTPIITSVAAVGDFEGSSHFAHVPQAMGNSSAVFISAGLDGSLESGDDDLIQFIPDVFAVASGVPAVSPVLLVALILLIGRLGYTSLHRRS